MSTLRNRLARVEHGAEDGRPLRYVVQVVREDGSEPPDPPDAECEAEAAALDAQGFRPERLIIHFVRRDPLAAPEPWEAADRL